MDVDIAHAHDFHSDDNKITFFYTVENGYQNALILEKWQDHARGFGLSAHVTSVVIW